MIGFTRPPGVVIEGSGVDFPRSPEPLLFVQFLFYKLDSTVYNIGTAFLKPFCAFIQKV